MANSLKLYVDPNNANPSRRSLAKRNEVRFSAGIVRAQRGRNRGRTSRLRFRPKPLAIAFADVLADLMRKRSGQRPWQPLVVQSSCLFVGQSGIGKSSLCMQLAINWALGRTTFGIRPERPLKSLIVQAENDVGDVAEMFRQFVGIGNQTL